MTQNGPGISPNLLMNFNPYDILQPQRSPQVERLIDIGDIPPNDVIDASLLDQKPRYELIDLFQNLYVTPELVKPKETAAELNVCSSTGNGIITSDNIDFKDFLDKIESGEKIDWTKPTKEEENKHSSIEMIRKPRVLIPKVSLEDDIEVEDLVAEILAKKNAERRILEELKKDNTADNKQDKNTSHDEVDFPPVKVLNAPTDINLTSTIKIPTNAKPDDSDFNLIEQLFRLKLNNTEKAKSSDLKIDGQIDNALNFKVIAIKKDEKVYRKKRIQKPENQTQDFTKGADYYEKSIVLPQIMLRIKARQAFLEERSSRNRKFVLDAGVRSDHNLASDERKNSKKSVSGTNDGKATSTNKKATDDWGKVSPMVLMADCNKERLQAWEQSRMFQNFIMNGK